MSQRSGQVPARVQSRPEAQPQPCPTLSGLLQLVWLLYQCRILAPPSHARAAVCHFAAEACPSCARACASLALAFQPLCQCIWRSTHMPTTQQRELVLPSSVPPPACSRCPCRRLPSLALPLVLALVLFPAVAMPPAPRARPSPAPPPPPLPVQPSVARRTNGATWHPIESDALRAMTHANHTSDVALTQVALSATELCDGALGADARHRRRVPTTGLQSDACHH
eukprot:3610577-Amphidinium_carterae.2